MRRLETTNELILPQGVPGNDADGIKMARDAGAHGRGAWAPSCGAAPA